MSVTEPKMFDVPLSGPPVDVLPTLAHECTVSGLRLVALPPGDLELSFRPHAHFFDININACLPDLAIGSDRVLPRPLPPDSVALVPAGIDFRARVRNELWNLLIELDPARAHALLIERLDGAAFPAEPTDYRPNPTAAILSRLALAHLRRAPRDRLYLEGLGLAIVAAGLACGPERRAPLALGGEDRRVARAMDYAEARLETDLSMAELAAVAGLSPSRFAACFKATTGLPVFAWVRERRLARARALLADPRLPLAEIAERAGFSDQSHMTRAFRARWGATPAAMRRDG